MLTQADSPLTSPTIITDQDLDPQGRALYSLAGTLIVNVNTQAETNSVKLTDGGKNMHTGHAIKPNGTGTLTVTIGRTMPGTNYVCVATQGDGFTSGFAVINNRTDTTFDIVYNIAGETHFSWMVIF